MEVTLSTTTQVAEDLNVDPSTVRDWAIAGRIPFELKTPGGHYRFDVEAVKTALKNDPETPVDEGGAVGSPGTAPPATAA